MTWRAVLEGAPAARAYEIVERLAAGLSPEHFAPEARGVGAGPAGLSLLFSYLGREKGDVALQRRAGVILEDELQRGLQPEDASLLSGFAGVVWLLQHIPGILGDSAAVLDHADRAIDEALGRPSWDGSFCHADGLIGLGVYLLERPNSPITERGVLRVVQHLGQLAVADGSGIAWLRAAESYPAAVRPKSAVFDLGMPRGVAGAIAFLSAALAVPAAVSTAEPLLRRVVDWFLQQQCRDVAWGRFGAARGPAEAPPAPTRLGWCYGDLGVSIALLAAARALSDSGLERFAADLALLTTERHGANTEVVDAGFCHGAGGAGHLYGRLFHATGDRRFLEASRRWFEVAIAMYSDREEHCGFLTYYPDAGNHGFHHRFDPGLLLGAAGIGLTLLSACRPVAPSWDRFLLVGLDERSTQRPPAGA